MTSRPLSIALLAANPALAGILARALEVDGGHKVATFEGIEALTTYLRISPVDVVVLDTELPGAPAIDIARGLRKHLKLANDDFAIVALTQTPAPFHRPLLAAGIDEVLQKPVTPARLLAVVDALCEPQREVAVGNGPMVKVFEGSHVSLARIGNVIPLFGEGRERR
jgi:two-component system phosphate regulon response regulator PhoB